MFDKANLFTGFLSSLAECPKLSRLELMISSIAYLEDPYTGLKKNKFMESLVEAIPKLRMLNSLFLSFKQTMSLAQYKKLSGIISGMQTGSRLKIKGVTLQEEIDNIDQQIQEMCEKSPKIKGFKQEDDCDMWDDYYSFWYYIYL